MKIPVTAVLISALGILSCAIAWASVPAPEMAASLDCRRAPAGSIDELVCRDEGLATLDSKMAQVLAGAQLQAADERPAALMAAQRRWLRSRNDCWKNRDRRACVESSYRQRIAELQARYRLLAGNGPISYACQGRTTSTVRITFFPTEPPTLIAERDGRSSLMFVQPSGSGARYQGHNESFWEHQGEATIVWGRGSAAMRCKPGSRE